MSLRRQRISSPGPPWAVLSQPSPSSSPSTQTSLIRSDIDVNMSNDEAENDLFSPHIPKRKADENIPSRRVTKLPRLDLSASQPPSCKLSSTSGTENVAGPSRTQPALVLPSRRSGGAQVRTASGDSSSESPGFGGTLSQAVQTINRKEREKEREKATRSRRPLGTARKKTCQPKNVRKVTTAALLWTAQLAGGDSVNDSLARTRIRPKKKQLRLNLDEVTAHSRPLDTVKNRGEIIELTDSSDSVRRPRPSQTSSSARPRIGAGSGAMLSASRDDPIVITSGSEDGRFPGTSPTPSQRNRDRDRAPASRQSKDKSCSGTWTRVPPPAAVDVISIPDSDEDAAPGSAPVPAPPRPVPVLVSTSTSKGRVLPHTSVSRVHASPAPAPPATPVAHQPPLGLQEGPSQRPPDPQPQPLENSPPDDVDDGDDGAFFDFDPVLDGDQSGELDWAVEPGPGPDTGMSGGGWGGSPVVTLGDADASAFTPAAANVPTCHRSDDAGLPRGDPTTPPLSPGLPSTAPVDALPPEPIEEDTMFDSYINMEEPFAVNDQETAETGTGGASQIVSEVTCAAMEAEIGVPGRTPEDGRACRRGAPGPSTLENGQIVADLNDVDECDGAHVGARQGIGHADGDRDVTMDLEPVERLSVGLAPLRQSCHSHRCLHQ
ncbi:hypothetical protein BS17DRAFT_317103 [Gyrodon lividus]|nr:hypothetical protein BS17DRAFT_317103 [Gyrodon lividus]